MNIITRLWSAVVRPGDIHSPSTSMTPVVWRRLEELFHAALALPAGERHAYLANACGDDAVLRSQVLALVASYEMGGEQLERPPRLLLTTLTGRALAHYAVGEKL